MNGGDVQAQEREVQRLLGRGLLRLQQSERIDKNYEQLWGWVEHMDQVRLLAAELVKSDAFYDSIVNGIAPDGTVNWPSAGLVRALCEAANEFAVDGWTPVAAVERWIMERSPEQQPSKHGCAS